MARKKRDKEAESGGFLGRAGAPAEGRSRLTPVDVQQKVFRLAFRGYNERDVDEFLDHVTEEIAKLHEENKRLREQLQEGGGAPGDAAEAGRQAETIVRRAREHAARLIEEADRRASSAVGAAASGGGLSASFLIKEREFLQELASLVQSHAKGLKEEARKARAEPDAASAPTAASAAATTGAMAASEATPVTEAGPEPEGGDLEEPEPSPEPEPLPEPEPVPEPKPNPAAESPSGPSPGEPAKPDSPAEATAPWGPVAGEAGDVAGEPPPAAWPQPDPGERPDPLLSAWESAFLAGTEGQGSGDETVDVRPYEETAGGKDKDRNEPSLRELFWGEE